MLCSIKYSDFLFHILSSRVTRDDWSTAILEAKRHGMFRTYTADVSAFLLQTKSALNDFLASNPYMAIEVTMQRSSIFQKYSLLPERGGVLGKVTDYYYRAESGTWFPHIHMILQIDSTPKRTHLVSHQLFPDPVDSIRSSQIWKTLFW